jgi:hypothetical protein
MKELQSKTVLRWTNDEGNKEDHIKDGGTRLKRI